MAVCVQRREGGCGAKPHTLKREYGSGEKGMPKSIAVPATVCRSPVHKATGSQGPREGGQAVTTSQETCLHSHCNGRGVP